MQMVGASQSGVSLLASFSAADRDRLGSRLFTVGHSNHEMDRFLGILRSAAVTAVADVRSSPFSQHWPQFNQPQLRRALEAEQICYLYLGDQLGGRPRDVDVYDAEGRVDYWKVRECASFKTGLARLVQSLKDHTIALMCAEEDPLQCHRGLMICPELIEQRIDPRHLRADGAIETTSQLETRLFELTGVGRGILDGLFAASVTPEERASLLVEAYRAQARRHAFRLPPGHGAAAIDGLEESASE